MKSRKDIALVLNALVVLFVAYTTVSTVVREGLPFARYYTHLSNLFAGVMSVAYLVSCFAKGKERMPSKAFLRMRFCAACCLFLTFVTVVFVLAPEKGGWKGYSDMLFGQTSVFTHLLTPLVFIVSFVFFESGHDSIEAWWSVVPTSAYAAVMIVLNVLKTVSGPYFFLRVYERPVLMSVVWVVTLLTVDFILGWSLLVLRKRLGSER